MSEIVNTHIKATESTTIAKLSVLYQIKLLISKFNNNDVAELDAAEKLSSIFLRMKASLQKLLKEAASVIDSGQHESVTLQVSSKYIPYLDEVISPTRGLGRFYKFEVFKKDLPANIDYMFKISIRKKVS